MQYPKGLFYARPEVKVLTGIGASTVSTSGVIATQSNMAQGSAINQRVGDRVKPLRFNANISFTVADTTNFCRYVIFQWKPDTALDAPAITDLFSDSTYPWVSVHRAAALSRSKMKILYDKTVALSTAGPQCLQLSVNLDLSKLPMIEYGAGATTGRNQIYVGIFSDSVAVTHPGYTVSSAFYFQDA